MFGLSWITPCESVQVWAPDFIKHARVELVFTNLLNITSVLNVERWETNKKKEKRLSFNKCRQHRPVDSWQSAVAA